MSINESKRSDPRMWQRWEKSGAIGTIDDFELAKVRKMGPLKLVGVGEHYAGPAAGKSTLSLGERVMNHGYDWSVTVPIAYAIVPGHTYSSRLNQMIELPRGAKPISKYFPNQ